MKTEPERWILLPEDSPRVGVSTHGRVIRLADGEEFFSTVIVSMRNGLVLYRWVVRYLAEGARSRCAEALEDAFHDASRHEQECEHSRSGTINGRCRLSDEEVESMHRLREVRKLSYSQLARRFCITKRQVQNILNGKQREQSR